MGYGCGMTAVGQRLHLRLFLEGVETPVISVSIQSQKNAAAVCSIQIPSNDYALDFRPRTLVHLFQYDLYNGMPPAEMVSVGGPGIRVEDRDSGLDPDIEGDLFPPERFESSDEQTQQDLENENYKLIFGGEIVGFSVSKTPTNRSITLQCVDWSSYWDIAYQYQVSGMSLGGPGIRGGFSGAATTVFNDFLSGSADVVTALIDTPPRAYPGLRGTLLGGITHLIEAIGGIYFGRRAIRGANDFFSLAEIRLHITQMLGANPFAGRDESRLMHANGFGSLFRRSLAGLGRLVSIRQVLVALQRYIFHEVIPITAPRYLPPESDPNIPVTELIGLDGDPELRVLQRAATQIKERSQELADRLTSIGPTTNEDGTVSAAPDADSVREASTRHGSLRTELQRFARICRRAAERAQRIARQLGATDRIGSFGFPDVISNFSSSGERFGRLLTLAEGEGSPPVLPAGGDFCGPVGRQAVEMMQQNVAAMTANLELRIRRIVPRTTAQPENPSRLITQVYRPDVWMVAPPRCNVIFPELYSQFQYGRDFQQEITRMMLRTHSAWMGSDMFFDGFYMAPGNIMGARRNRHILGGRGGVEPPEESDLPLHIRRDMLDHELYTGIIPAFERMSDLNLHALRGGATEIDGVRVGYAQLACNHIFFQYRFRSRQLMVSGKYNPYVVLGFPMVVIDKYLPIDHLRTGEYSAATAVRLAEAIREGDGEVGSPEERALIREAHSARVSAIVVDVVAARPNTHFFGTPSGISHSVDSSTGGSTQIQMEYARDSNERTEFLGDNVGRPTRARRTRNQNITSTVACLEPPPTGSRGPRGGEITSVTECTDEYRRRLRRGARTRSRATTTTPAATTDTATPAAETPTTGDTTTPAGAVSATSPHASDGLLPLFVPGRRTTGRRRRGTRVAVGIEQSAADYGLEVVAIAGTAGATNSATGDTLVTFSAYRIVENCGVYVAEDRVLPPEDVVFPPWYGESWRTSRIGALYGYLFGTGALTDQTTIIDPHGVEAARYDGGTTSGPDSGTAVDRSTTIRLRSDLMNLTDEIPVTASPESAISSDASTEDVVDGEEIGPPGAPDEIVDGVLAEIGPRSHISEALEEVVRAYSLIKLNNFDVHQFLRAYTWRPIASMVDLFGTANLEINDDGNVVRGVEGFHSRAFGDFDDLRQLVGTRDGSRPATILGLTTRDPDEVGEDRATRDETISARLDTRKEKRIRVLRYINSLMSGCGILG